MTTEVAVTVVTEQQKAEEAASALTVLTERAEAISVTTDAEFEVAAEAAKEVEAAYKRIVKEIKDPKERAHGLWKWFTGKESAAKQARDTFRRIVVDGKMATYKRQQEEAARRAREEAERKAREEQERIQREREAQEAQERAKREEEALKAAEEFEAAGDTEGAQRILEEATEAPPANPFGDLPPAPEPVVPVVVNAPPPPKADGVSFVKVYSCRVFDVNALIKAAAMNPAWAGLVQPNQQALDALARGMKESFRVPGCELQSRESSRVRG